MTEVLGSLFWYIVTIGLLVTFHEFGHFWVARRFGVKVHRFSIGFGKPLWSRFGRDGTEYVLAAIPLGGYVAMLDERAEDVAPEDLSKALNRKPVWQKIAVSAAGPVANLVMAVFVFWLLFLVGKPDFHPVIGDVSGLTAEAGLRRGMHLDEVDGRPIVGFLEGADLVFESALYRRDVTVAVTDAAGQRSTHVLRLSSIPANVRTAEIYPAIGLYMLRPAIAGEVIAGDPADRAGLKLGDQIVSVDGTQVLDFDALIEAVQANSADGVLHLQIMRGSERRELEIIPKSSVEAGKTRYAIGVASPQLPLKFGPIEAIPNAVMEVVRKTRQSVRLMKDMFVGELSTENLSGPITIARVANSTANYGLPWFLGFLGAVSLGLAILNLLPIPILDGGHILYYLIELIKGSPVSDRALVAGQYIGLVLLTGLIGLAFFNDLSGFFR